VFSTVEKYADGKARDYTLLKESDKPIVRHIKIKVAANPHDPSWDELLGNSHARLLGGWTRVTASDYPTTVYGRGLLDARTGSLQGRCAAENGLRQS
jgi:hypothetical protein